jgi:serralysin
MAGIITGVPQNPTTNPLVNTVIAGGNIWDMSTGPLSVKVYEYSQGTANWAAVVEARGDGRSTYEPNEILRNQTDSNYWGQMREAYMYAATQAFSSVSNIQFARASGYSDADIVWFKALRLSEQSLGQDYFFGELPSPDRKSWGYVQDNLPKSGEYDFQATVPDATGGIGYQNHLGLIAQNIGLKMQNSAGSPYSVMSYNNVPTDSNMYHTHGFMETLGPVDIAAVQALYGANMNTATGNDVYVLPSKNEPGVGYATIWDAGGTDIISAQNATGSVSINLNAASLNPSDPNAYGSLSHQVVNEKVYGGFLIANGVRIEVGVGGAHNDLLVSDDGTTANRLEGGAGDDTYYVDSLDTVYDPLGVNKVYVNGVLSGGGAIPNGGTDAKGRTIVSGTAKTLKGGAGSDWVDGGKGKDAYYGGGGKDYFVFTSRSKNDAKTLKDFNVAQDSIVLKAKAFTKLSKVGDEKAIKSGNFYAGLAAHDRDDRIIYNSKNGAILYDADGTGGGAAVTIGKVKPGLKLTKADFLLDI